MILLPDRDTLNASEKAEEKKRQLLNARKVRILHAIIDDYVLTALPVGSVTICRKYEPALSSATIRNEMSALEALGYLAQPHVSAGRVPSVKAYRLYVDSLLQNGVMPLDEENIRSYLFSRIRQRENAAESAGPSAKPFSPDPARYSAFPSFTRRMRLAPVSAI